MTVPDKKTEIVRAAFSILMRGGLQSLTFRAVANEAGLSRQLVRYYFADNEALMVALCDHLAGLYRESLVNGVSELDESRRLSFFLDFYFDLLDGPKKPRDDQAYDAAFAFAAGSAKVRENLRLQDGLLGQVVSHELQLQHPELTTAASLELSYLFVCLMYGHWKMVATLGYGEHHNLVTRRAMDRLIASYLQDQAEIVPGANAWSASG